MSIDKRLKRLERRFRPNPKEAEREEAFRIEAVILDAFESLLLGVPDRLPLKYQPPEVTDRLVEEAVPIGLRAHGFSEKGIEELTPAYVEAFKEAG